MLLWLSFTVLRVLGLPLGMGAYLRDALAWPHLWRQLPLLLRYTQLPAVGVVFSLSMYWYAQITRGVLKAVVGVGSETSRRKRA